MAKADTEEEVRPVFAEPQFPPALALLNTPYASIPKYRMAGVWGSMATACTYARLGTRVLAALQLAPPLVLLNTPPARLDVPAYSVVDVWGSMATAYTDV